jgi:hypothetical protein
MVHGSPERGQLLGHEGIFPNGATIVSADPTQQTRLCDMAT